jgi:hypothetical protein
MRQVEAQASLDKLRGELGLGPAPGADAPALESGAEGESAPAAPAPAADQPPAGSGG